MGSAAADKLREIEELRASLGGKLQELEERLPLTGLGKKAVGALAGSSVAGSALAFGFRRLRARRKKKKRSTLDSPPVVVNVVPKGAAWVAAAGLAAWGGFKVFQAVRGASASTVPSTRPAVVTPMPESGRQTGSS